MELIVLFFPFKALFKIALLNRSKTCTTFKLMIGGSEFSSVLISESNLKLPYYSYFQMFIFHCRLQSPLWHQHMYVLISWACKRNERCFFLIIILTLSLSSCSYSFSFSGPFTGRLEPLNSQIREKRLKMTPSFTQHLLLICFSF